MSTHRMMPPASLRLRIRLAHLRCGFCGTRERPDESGRVIGIAHFKQAICELCNDEADVMTKCAQLARVPAKAKPVKRVAR